MFDPMGCFEVPSVSRKWIAGRFGVRLSPENHPLKSAKYRGNKIGFYLCKKGQGQKQCHIVPWGSPSTE